MLRIAIIFLMCSNFLFAEDSMLREFIEESGAVGAAVAVIDHGKVEYYTYGESITEDTVFDLGSITKVFTTLLLKDLEKKGILSLQDLAELPGVKMPGKITLFHLATHSSGLPRLPDNFHPKNYANPYADYNFQDLCSFLNGYTLPRGPGEQVEYSNVGMGLLGIILCQKTGKSFETLLSESIFKPIGMEHSAILLTPEMSKKYATGYHMKKAVPNWDFPEHWAGAGAIHSTIKDMAKFLAANMGNSPMTDLLQECHQKQLPMGPGVDIGLGWILTDDNDLIWHNGGTGGFRSYLGFNAKTQKGVVILSNSSEDWPDDYALCLLDPNHKRVQINKLLANDTAYMSRFVGNYDARILISADSANQNLEITLYGTLLATSLSGGEVGMLYPIEEGVFGIKGFSGGIVRFEFDEDGKVSKVTALFDGTILWEAFPK